MLPARCEPGKYGVECLPDELLTGAAGGAENRSTEQCLVDVIREATAFYEVSVSITASLFAEPALLHRHRAGVRALGMGPQIPSEKLAEFLRAEQRRGRIGDETDPKAVADALVGACLHRAFLAHFWGEEPTPTLHDFAAGLVRAVVNGISPPMK